MVRCLGAGRAPPPQPSAILSRGFPRRVCTKWYKAAIFVKEITKAIHLGPPDRPTAGPYAQDRRLDRSPPFLVPPLPRRIRGAGRRPGLQRRSLPARRHHVGAGPEGPLLL